MGAPRFEGLHPQSKQYDLAKIRAHLRKWQDRVLDLTRGNPLLCLNRSRVTKLRVVEPRAYELFARFALPDEAVLRMPYVRRHTVVQQGLYETDSEAPEPSIEPGDLTFDVSASDLARRLRRIYDNARTTIEERGVTTLYLSFGTLQWQDESLGESVSPLWMIPCELRATGSTTPLKLLRADDEMQINPALELYLRERHKIKVPSLPEELAADSFSRFLEETQNTVAEARWVVNDGVWLSTYTFESLVIYQDLKVMEDAALRHPIVAALARAASLPDASERLGDDLDNAPTPEVVPISILPTDSSQLESLAYVASGRNLVMHGPPGTGKSQTISNLIADALGMDKKVLFVSAKMAALNVVYQRLAEKGLGRFCLEAHSTKAGKAKIADELRRILELDPDVDGSALSEHLAKLVKARADLNAYVRELHERIAPLDLTAYGAIGKCAALQKQDVPELRFDLPWKDPLSVTKAELESVLETLADLSVQASTYDSRATHPWRGFSEEGAGKLELQAVEADCATIAGACQSISEWLGHLDPLVRWEASPSLDQIHELQPVLQALVNVERLPERWAHSTPEQLSIRASILRQAGEKVTDLASKEPAYRAVLDLDFQSGQDLLAPAETRFSAWHRRLTPSYWSWRREVRKALRPGVEFDFSKVRGYYALASTLVEIRNWIAQHSSLLVESLGDAGLSDGLRVRDASEEHRAASVLKQWQIKHGIPSIEGGTVLPPALRSAAKMILETIPTRNEAIRTAAEHIDAAWAEGLAGGSPVTKASIDSLIRRCREITESPQLAFEWIQLYRTLRRCTELGLAPFIRELGGTTAELAVPAFQLRFCSAWADRAIQRGAYLSGFSGLRHQELVGRFQQLDSEIREVARRRITAIASEPAQRVREARTDLGTRSEVGILRYELGKKRRIKPLRRLFAEIPHVLQALKPCMLMSPVSVSTYLKPGALEFDVVVFDEASQVPTAEAIPSILRAKQVVVAGDANQLPPTSFFASSLLTEGEADDEEEESFEPLDSLLDDCVAIVPTFQEAFLRWHYRSRDERLIKFSNHYIYDNRLITFPSCVIGGEESGVRLQFVQDGVWDRGKSRTNRREARRVAEVIVEQLEQHPERSLGVAAMNIQQREAIEDALDEQIADKPDLRALLDANQHEPFFVKALENVQGDERDTIVISIGYGRDASGILTHNFGPLNMEGGWRRLNVLVTRAKWQTILVTSLRSSDLNGINPQNRGAVALKNYIEYAERGAELPRDPAVLASGETNDFEDGVRDSLVDRGLRVDQQVGASAFRIDLGIRDRRDPTRYILGLECDGATYHSARTARDRDVLRQEVLRGMGWRIHHIWSVDWFRDPEKEISAVLAGLARAEAQPVDSLPVAPVVSNPSRPSSGGDGNPTKTPQPTRNYRRGQPYRMYAVRFRLGRNIMLNSWNVTHLAKRVVDVVEVEGPIHVELLAERLKELHGIERLGSNVQANVDNAIKLAVEKHGLRYDRTRAFVSVPSQELSAFRLATAEVRRPIHLIAPEELSLAVLFLVEEQFGVHQDSIGSAVAKLFGFERVGTEAADMIRDVVDSLVDRGQLRRSGFQLYLP